jgi:uncharacterized protein (DUF952 family)
MPTAFHLTPCDQWEAQREIRTYAPPSLSDEGFIHCTDGEENVIAVGNRYYAADPREMVCLIIDVGTVTSEIRYEDPARIYPHIYGKLNVDAVIGVRSVIRGEHGEFLRLGPPVGS